MISTQNDPVVFKDDKDWLETALFVVFLIIFPVALFAIWRAPEELIPWPFALLMTVPFLLATPFMVRRVRAARSRTLSVDATTGRIRLTERTPFRRSQQTFDVDEVTRIVMSADEHDGAWYTAYITARGREIVFAQGSVKKDVEDRTERLFAALSLFRPDLYIARRST